MRFITITRKQIMFMGCLLLALTAVAVGSIGIFAGSDRKLPIYCVETDKKQIAISFDAAWGNEDTQKLIDVLGEYKVPATFFCVGTWVDKYPESVEALHKAGHSVQNHSNTHPYLTQLSPEKITDEIRCCNEKITKITGICPTLLRPPYGDYDNNVISAVESEKMFAIQWSVDSYATVGKAC